MTKNIEAVHTTSLIKSFFATFPSVRDGLVHLNLALGTRYEHGHKSRWERGERAPDVRARAVMLNRVLPQVLKDHGKATAADVRAALDKLL